MPCDSGSVGQWRIIQPFKKFSSDEFDVDVFVEGMFPRHDYYDGVIIQRPIGGCIELIQTLKQQGKKVVIECDDMYPIEDTENPTYEMFKPDSPAANHVLECMRLADGVMTNTDTLLTYYSKFNKNVGLFPNAIDFNAEIYTRPRERVSDKITMLWSGSSGHGSNLSIVVDAVQDAMKENDKFVLAICSSPNNIELLNMFDVPADRKIEIPSCPYHKYGNLHSVADFVIAPLKMNSYNLSKSNIRLLEPAVWSVPAIASPVGEYQAFQKATCSSPLAYTKNDWKQQILNFVDDDTFRKSCGKHANEYINDNYDIVDVNTKRETWFRELFN